MVIEEDISKRITSLRFLLIMFIVFLHSILLIYGVITPFEFVLINQYKVFGFVHKLFTNLAASSVGVFFIFSSFLQYIKNYEYKTLVIKKIKGLLVPYIIWISLAVFTIPLLKLIIARVAPWLFSEPDNISILRYKLSDWIGIYTGLFRPLQNPYISQFWFIRDLFFLSIISPVLLSIEKKLPFLQFFIVIFLLISNFDVKPFIYNERIITAYFFYLIGMYWAIYDIKLLNFVDKFKWKSCLILLLIMLLISNKIKLNVYVNTTFPIIIMMLKLSKIIIQNDRLFLISKNLSPYSFFLFAIHMPFIMDSYIIKFWMKIFPMNNLFFWLVNYFIASSLIIVIGTCIGFVLRKFCKPIYVLLNGGR